MTESPADPQTEALAAAIPGLERVLRAAADQAMTPGMPPRIALAFFQIVVGWARTIRQYRKAAGLPSGWPTELALLLGSVRASAEEHVYDPALTAPQALRFYRAAYALAQAVLLARPVPEKTKKPAPNPFARLKPLPPLPRLPDAPHAAESDGDPALDLAAMLDPAIATALRAAAVGSAPKPLAA